MATDSKGVYFNQGNRGFATILQRAEQGSFFDSALRVAQREQSARQKEEEDILGMLEPDDIWSPYAQAANKILEDGIEAYAQGKLDKAGAMKLAVEYQNAQSQAKGLQKMHKEARVTYEKDDEIVTEEALKWRFGEVVGDGTLGNLSKVAVTGTNDLGFLDNWGGSKALRANKVVSNLVDTLRQTLEENLGSQQKEYIGPGAVRLSRQNVSTLLNQAFEEGIDANGKKTIKIKDIQALRDNGLLKSFLDDPKFHRIVVDSLYDKSGGQKTSFTPDEIDQEAANLINLYGSDKQELKVDEDAQNARYSVPRPTRSRGDNEVDAQESMAVWYQHLMSGDPTLMNDAASYLVDTQNISALDLSEIISSADRSKLINKDGKLRSGADDASFEILNAKPVTLKDGSIGMQLRLSSDTGVGTFFSGYKIREGSPFVVTIDLQRNPAPEFWNKYYNLAKNKSKIKDEKPHYLENKGGQIGSTQPAAPQGGNTPTANPWLPK